MTGLVRDLSFNAEYSEKDRRWTLRATYTRWLGDEWRCEETKVSRPSLRKALFACIDEVQRKVASR